MDRLRFLVRRRRRLRERRRDGRALDALHVVRPRRAGLVRLRLGNPTARNRVSGDLPLPAARWPSVSETRAAAGDALVVSLAGLSHHARRSAHQTSRGHRLARSDRALLSLRNPTDPQSFEPLVSLLAALEFES